MPKPDRRQAVYLVVLAALAVALVWGIVTAGC